MKKDPVTRQTEQPLRRKALVGLLGGSASLAAWQTPVVKSLVLPAHATTSMPVVNMRSNFFGTNIQSNVVSTDQGSPIDMLVQSAYAGSFSLAPTFSVTALVEGTDSYVVNLLNRRGDVLRRGTLNESGAAGSLDVLEDPCMSRRPGSIPAMIVSVSETELVLQLERAGEGGQGQSVRVNVPSGSGPVPTLSAVCEEEMEMEEEMEQEQEQPE